MEDFVRKTKGVRDINSLPLNVNHELDIVSDVKGKIYIKILNRYKELLFDNGTEQWVIDKLNDLEVDVEQLKEDILDIEQVLSELPMIADKLETVETKLTQVNTLFTQMQIDVNGLDLRTAELEREVVQLALKDQELLDKINNLDLNVDLDILYSNSDDFGDYDYSGNQNLMNNLSFSDFSVQIGNGNISDGGEFLKINKTAGANLYVMAGYKNSEYYLAPVLPNTTYTITYTLRKSSNFVPQSGKRILLRYRLNQNVTTYNFGELILDSTNLTEEFTTYTKTFNTGALVNPNSYYFQTLVEEGLSGEIELSYEIKLELGSTATTYQPNLLEGPYWLSKTPFSENIPYYKYVGINLEYSKNPNDYHWIPLAKATETVDARLTKTITTNDTVNALQNSRLTALESKVVDTAWTNITPISPFTATKQIQVKRQNGIVYMRGALAHNTTNNSIGDCFTLPEGFRPPSDGGYEYHYLLPGQSNTQSDVAKIYVRPNGLCSIVSKTGTTPIFLEPIIFSIT